MYIANSYDGITNDGEAHIVEYFYDAIKLRKADGKPLVGIINSLKQTLYSVKYVDNTGRKLKKKKRSEVDATLVHQDIFNKENEELVSPNSASDNKDTTSSAKTQTNEQKLSLITPEMDADYLSAVERGDMATAQRMVMEAAEKAGYIADTSYHGSLAFNGAAPMANDYFETKGQRKEAWDNGDYEGTMSLGDYADSNIDTNDLEWQLTDSGNYRIAEDCAKESIDKKDSALSVLNEIISYFVGEIPQDKLIDYYQGEIDIEDNILSDFKISLIENKLKRKFIAALRPVILENLEIQKRNYNERKGKAIVIARGYSGPYGGSNEKPTSSNSGSRELGETITRGRGEAQGGVLQKVGAQKDQSVAPTRTLSRVVTCHSSMTMAI